MKKKLKIGAGVSVLLILCILLSCCLCSCNDGTYRRHSGKYKLEWSIMLKYGSGHGDGVERDDYLILNSDGNGKYKTSGVSELDIRWDLDGLNDVYITTTGFSDMINPVEFHGEFDDEGGLHLYDGNPKDEFTVEYFFKKVYE